MHTTQGKRTSNVYFISILCNFNTTETLEQLLDYLKTNELLAEQNIFEHVIL